MKILKALCGETRFKIIEFLSKQNKCFCICHITEHVKKHPSNVLRHVLFLEKAGIVKTKKDGKFLFCCLKNKNKIKRLINLIKEV